MSEVDEGAGAAQEDPGDAGVLGRLPRTRPQRSSPRRAAARKSTTAATAATTNGAAPAAATSATAQRVRSGQRATRKAKPSVRAGGARVRSARVLEDVPPQGYECEDDAARGTVRPPGSAELVASAVELVGELAKSGISTGERLVKDALSRLPLS